MPELPEVETVVKDLNRRVKGRRIIDVWTDWPKYFSVSEKDFKKKVKNRRILGAQRRGKNILIRLSKGRLLLIHQKMTGHLLYGMWERGEDYTGSFNELSGDWRNEEWIPVPPIGNLGDAKNRFIRLVFFLDNGKMLVLSDVRRFAKVLCASKKEILESADIKNLGPEPLDKSFTFGKFEKLFKNNSSTLRKSSGQAGLRTRKGSIKKVLMDQNFIVGIGNIYSDEILYLAKIHPLSQVEKLGEKELSEIFKAIKKVLQKAIKARGTSIDDFRDTSGTKGLYGEILMVYQRTGKKCRRGHIIKRIKVAGRSAHFCPVEQKLYK